MSSYSPFGWSFGYSVLRSIKEKRWYTKWNPATEKEEEIANDGNAKPSFAATIGWVLLRIVLCIDMSLIFELVGRFVLNAVHFKMYDYRTHQNAYAITFIAAIGGLVQAVLLITFDLIYMKGDDPVGDVSKKGYLTREENRKLRNVSEGGVLTYRKLRTHALVRIVIWPIYAAAGGAVAIALWHVHKNTDKRRLDEKIATAIIVQVVGAAVVTVGPSLIQLVSTTADNIAPLPRTAKK